jgi:Domain of unknown function (DUF4126)
LDFQEFFSSLLVGIGLAAATGFRVFIPLLLTSMILFFKIDLPGFQDLVSTQSWLASTPALLGLSIACIFEVLAYKIPGVDHFLDLIMTPTALLIGTILTSLFLSDINDPFLKYGVSFIFGGSAASLVQLSTVSVRSLSSKFTFGFGNTIFALIESFSAIIFTILAFLAPLLTLAILVLLGIIVYKLYQKIKASTE